MFERIRSIFGTRKRVEFRDAEFGVLTLEYGMWSGQMERNGKTIHFCVSGTDTEPDVVLLDGVRRILDGADNVEQQAVNFLRAQDPANAEGDFTLRSIDFPWEDKPKDHVMEFTLAGDPNAIWRMEFIGGEPKFIGRED